MRPPEDGRKDRRQALAEACASWGGPDGQTVTEHAHEVTRLAAAFAAFLTDGAVHPNPNMPDESTPDESSGLFADLQRRAVHTPRVIAAALRWVDDAHENSLSGPENWRNWADDKDINLINAVREYRGLEPIA